MPTDLSVDPMDGKLDLVRVIPCQRHELSALERLAHVLFDAARFGQREIFHLPDLRPMAWTSKADILEDAVRLLDEWR